MNILQQLGSNLFVVLLSSVLT